MKTVCKKLLAMTILMSFVLAGCAGTPEGEWAGKHKKGLIGGMGGAAAGGLVAAAFHASPAGIVAGVLVGGLIGGAIGNHLDKADHRKAEQAAHRALEQAPSGTTVAWHNPDNGHSGTITPTRTYKSGSGQYCREYQQTVTIGGDKHQAYGTACRQPDGSWKVKS